MKHNADKFLKENGAYMGMGLYEISVKNLEDFAKLVEQATLERAAKHFDERGKYADGSWSVGWYDPEDPGIILRALKDSHE